VALCIPHPHRLILAGGGNDLAPPGGSDRDRVHDAGVAGKWGADRLAADGISDSHRPIAAGGGDDLAPAGGPNRNRVHPGGVAGKWAPIGSPPSRRLPVRDASGAVLYVVHDSTLTAFAESVGQTTSTLDKMLGDLLASTEFKQLVTAMGFVSEKATVSDARKENLRGMSRGGGPAEDQQSCWRDPGGSVRCL
jgi:hypothetical protein